MSQQCINTSEGLLHNESEVRVKPMIRLQNEYYPEYATQKKKFVEKVEKIILETGREVVNDFKRRHTALGERMQQALSDKEPLMLEGVPYNPAFERASTSALVRTITVYEHRDSTKAFTWAAAGGRSFTERVFEKVKQAQYNKEIPGYFGLTETQFSGSDWNLEVYPEIALNYYVSGAGADAVRRRRNMDEWVSRVDGWVKKLKDVKPVQPDTFAPIQLGGDTPSWFEGEF